MLQQYNRKLMTAIITTSYRYNKYNESQCGYYNRIVRVGSQQDRGLKKKKSLSIKMR